MRQKCSLPFLSDLEQYSMAADKPLFFNPQLNHGCDLTSWSRTLILLQLGQFLQEGQSEWSSSNSTHWGWEGGERCNGLCHLCLFAKSDGWFLCLWHVFLAAERAGKREAQGNSDSRMTIRMALAMTSNCKTWTQCPSWVTLSKLGLSVKAVIPSTKVFPLANELWDNSLVILPNLL